jgi:hypothetical protein
MNTDVADVSKDRSIRNEQLVRQKNTNVKNGIKKYFHNNKKVKTAPVAFICECSALDCQKHIRISIDDYEKIHGRDDHFVIFKGHELPDIEKIVADKPGFSIVEKYQLNP